MSVPLRLFVGCVVLVGALLFFQNLSTTTPIVAGGAPETDRGAAETELVDLSTPGARVPAPGGRVKESAPQPTGFSAIPAHAGLVRVEAVVHGRVVDFGGRPVAGIDVRAGQPPGVMGDTGEFVAGRTLARTVADASGLFELEAALPLVLSAESDRYATLFECRVASETEEALIVVAERIPLGGIVVDEQGVPLSDVRINVTSMGTPSAVEVGPYDRVIPVGHTNDGGVFLIGKAVEVQGAQLHFRTAGRAPLTVPVPAGGDSAMTVVMPRDEDSLYNIRGRVLLGDGNPAVGALVSTGNMASPVDENGFFVIDFEAWLEHAVDQSLPTTLTAVRSGLVPVSRVLPSVSEARKTGWPDGLVIVLQNEPMTLRGIVVDTHGTPLSGVLVEPLDMTFFGYVPARGLPAFSGRPKTVEQLAGGGEAYTGEDGRFALEGLTDRTYSICALRRGSLLCTVSEPMHSGEQNARIVLDEGDLGTISGRIVDRHGEGTGGVRISVSRKRISELMIGNGTDTEADGSFSIPNVTTTPEFLRIEGEAVVPELFRELEDGDDVTDLELQVGRRCRVRFDWGAWPGTKDTLSVVDEEGAPLMMMRVSNRAVGEAPSVPFQQGVTGILVVSDAATHAVVYRDGEEVTRIPIEFVVDQVTVVRL